MVFIMQKFSVLDMTADDKVDPNVVLNGHDRLNRGVDWVVLFYVLVA